MKEKPIIAYVESDRADFIDYNPYRDSLCYFLREYCGCEVVQYQDRSDFKEDLPRLKKYFACRQLILVIVTQEKYSDQHNQVLLSVRKEVSETLPVAMIPDFSVDEPFSANSDDKSAYAFDYSDTGLADLVNSLVAEWTPPCNWLGAETAEDIAFLLAQLETAYTKNYPSEGDLSAVDSNHMIVAEALHIRLLPVSLLKAEFDDTIEKVQREYTPVKPSAYNQETEKIRMMSDNERKAFSDKLDKDPGTVVGWGSKVNGFAIDPVTMETCVTYGFGEHALAIERLEQRIRHIEELKSRRHFGSLTEEEEMECYRRIITGLIFPEVSGFSTPILMLYTRNRGGLEQQISAVASFLKNQQKFIPVDIYGQLL